MEELYKLFNDICIVWLLLFSIMAHKHINNLIAEVEVLKNKLKDKED